MPDHDQEGPLDRARLPRRPDQPIEKAVQSDSTEARKSDAATCEEDRSEIPTRWQRIKGHPAFKPVLAVGGLVAVSGITLLTLRSEEGLKQVSAAALAKVPEFTNAAFDGIGEAARRKSPVEHMVNGYQRVQHYGPGRAEARIVEISSYLRGGSA